MQIKFLFLLFPVLVMPVDATPVQKLDSIRKAVREFVQGQFPQQNLKKDDIQISGLDKRLRLANCRYPLQTRLGPGNLPQRIRSVEVKCRGPKAWTVYVPVKIHWKYTVLRLKRSLARHQIVSADDVELTTQSRSDDSLMGAVSSVQQVTGYRTKYPLNAGTILQSQHLLPPMLVKRGQMVVIVYKTPMLSIRMSGTALMNGEEGAVISVQNAKSKRIISARVIADGVVAVTP